MFNNFLELSTWQTVVKVALEASIATEVGGNRVLKVFHKIEIRKIITQVDVRVAPNMVDGTIYNVDVDDAFAMVPMVH